jgi:epoxyqueuosine reductase
MGALKWVGAVADAAAGGSNMTLDRGTQIIEKAQALGASMAGIASAELLKQSPSHKILRKLGTKIDGLYSIPEMPDFRQIDWPAKAKSALVVAVSHPQGRPQLDWYDPHGTTPGNRELIRIIRELSVWVEETFAIKSHKKPYYVEKEGIYLKDAAFLAGLGCVGKNNLFLALEHGPRVRLRSMLLEAELTPTGPIEFDPCDGCEEFCRTACPQSAFEMRVHSSDEIGMTSLPGRDGHFSRARCMSQIDYDEYASGVAINEAHMAGVDREEKSIQPDRIKYCRSCEFACPVGS